MKNNAKILVPTDFSASAENAFRYALLMSDKAVAEITLLHVINPDIAMIDVPVALEIAAKEKMEIAEIQMETSINKVLTQLGSQIKNVPEIHTKLEIGNPEVVINNLSKTGTYDFICMGTRDKHGPVDKIFGSVASNVIQKALCPVFVIPELASYSDTTLVTYATNLRKVDPYEIWKLSKRLAPFNPIIRCVHLTENKEDGDTAIKMEELEAFFSEQVPALQISFHEVATKDKVQGLLDFLETNNTNLLVTYRPNRNFWNRLLHKSFTRKMAFETKVPMVVLNEES